MMSAKTSPKIVFCLSDKAELVDPVLKLAGKEWLKGAQIHLINVFEQKTYAYELSTYVWPDQSVFDELKQNVDIGMQKTADKLVLDAEDRKKVLTHCFLHHSPKQKIVEYCEEIGADLVVVVTRGNTGIKGLFTSSTAEYLMKFSPCDVYVMRA